MIADDFGPFGAWKARADERISSGWQCTAGEAPFRVCVEGIGDWGRKVYRPALQSAADAGLAVTALYRDILPAVVAGELAAWERFELKAAPFAPFENQQDLLLVATPDTAHVGVLEASLGRYATALVEKPFCPDRESLRRAGSLVSRGADLWGVDHYPSYIATAAGSAESIGKHLGNGVTRVDFALLQKHPIERERLPSLGLGLGLDMLPHFLALLVSLGLHGKLERLEVGAAGQHVMEVHQDAEAGGPGAGRYPAETWLEIEFELSKADGSGPLLCRAVAGKGLPLEVKYLDLFGVSGRVVRCDLGSDSRGRGGYPGGYISYLSGPGELPRESTGFLGSLAGDWRTTLGPPLDTRRPYSRLLAELMCGKLTAGPASCLFTMEECAWMVEVLCTMLERLATFRVEYGGSWPGHAIGSWPAGWRSTAWT